MTDYEKAVYTIVGCVESANYHDGDKSPEELIRIIRLRAIEEEHKRIIDALESITDLAGEIGFGEAYEVIMGKEYNG